MKHVMSTIARFCAPVALCLPLFTGLAHTQAAEVHHMAVHTRDLDLRSQQGVAMLHHRVALGATKVCGPVEMLGAPEFNVYTDCVDQARRDAEVSADQLVASVRATRAYALAAPPQ